MKNFLIFCACITIFLFPLPSSAKNLTAPEEFLKIDDAGWQHALNMEISVDFKNADVRDIFYFVSRSSSIAFTLDPKLMPGEEKETDKAKKKNSYVLSVNFKKIRVKDLLFHLCQKCKLSAAFEFGPFKEEGDIPEKISLIPKKE